MTIKNRLISRVQSFNLPVSYRIGETRPKLRDSQNVFYVSDRMETRYGFSRYHATACSETIESISYFKHSDGTRYIFAKGDDKFFQVEVTGEPSVLTGGFTLDEDRLDIDRLGVALTSGNKHRAITWDDRHIMAIGTDGLKQFGGSDFDFTQLGQAAPTAPTLAALAGGALADKTWTVSLTFYSTITGFETNEGATSSGQATSGANNSITVSDIPTTAANGTIDKVRVYLKNSTDSGDSLFIKEIALGVGETTITDEGTSTQVPPTTHSTPPTDVNFLVEFNSKLVVASDGSNDVKFSEQDFPDAFDDSGVGTILYAKGPGNITGLAVGLFDNNALDPYLVIFKKRSFEIYSERDDFARSVKVSNHVGCVSADTIRVINGDVRFMSDSGFREIHNGRLREKSGHPDTLGSGDIDDLFNDASFELRINKAQSANFHSVYYNELKQYITFVCEATSTSKTKALVYHDEISGFLPYVFPLTFTASVEAEDSNGNEIMLFASGNRIYKHSKQENRTDINASNTAVQITAFAILRWLDANDLTISYLFNELTLRALVNTNNITVKTWIDFNTALLSEQDYAFTDPSSGFVLDVSKLDEGVFGMDGRNPVQVSGDVNRVGKNISVGFYQKATNSNIGLIAAQLDLNKNGNDNV